MSRTRAKRYLGMTVPQWLVLGVLGLLICGTLAGGYWWLNSMVVSANAVPDLPVVEVTPLPTSTLQPTETPVPTPSATPILYDSLIPAGWKLFLSEAAPGMEIWLPSSYVPQTAEDRKKAIPILDTQDAGNNDGVVSALTLKDTTPSKYLLVTTFEMVKVPVFGNSLDEMVDDQFGVLIRSSKLLERDEFVFKVTKNPARRLVFNFTVGGMDSGLVVYVVQVGTDLYYLGFVTPFNELYERMPVFDQSAQTFRVVPVIPTPMVPTNTALPQ